MQLFVDFLALACAASAIILAWMQPEGLFEEFRDKISAWGSYSQADLVEGGPRWWPWLRYKAAHGLQCRVCLTYHCVFWLAVLFILPSYYYDAIWLKMPVYILATIRISVRVFEGE